MEEKPPIRKMKFIPRAPPKRVPKPEVKTEVIENDDSTQAKDLLRRITEGALRKPKAEKRVPASEVAWMGGVVNSSRSHKYLNGSSSNAGGFGSNSTQETEYREQWDYYSYYPITHPIRRPYSGDPELLDVEEFIQNTQTAMNNGDSLNAATELGLMENRGENKMLFMRLPSIPLSKQSAKTENHEATPNMKAGDEKKCGIKDLPKGCMGKLLVYKSGAVKLKVGQVLYDVNPGLKNEFAQDVMAVDVAEKTCALVGEVGKHVVLTPDIDSLLKDISK